MFARVLVANRGEIALRVLPLHALGIEGVAVYSDADVRPARARRRPRGAARPAPAARSYLAIEQVVAAALETGCEAVHPGYGFLSERPEFAARLHRAGSRMALARGDGAARRQGRRQAGGRGRVGGPSCTSLGDAEIVVWAGSQQLPLLVKAVASGGGKGMRVVRSRDELPEALRAARSEARCCLRRRPAARRALDRAAASHRGQVLADEHGSVLHLGERSARLQRRHQKVIEEAPSPVVGPELRGQLAAPVEPPAAATRTPARSSSSRRRTTRPGSSSSR